MFLKIENPGICPVEGFTLLGATSKRGNASLIGQFGSGNKHAAGVLLRAGLAPIIFCSNHRLEFGTKQGRMAALEGDTDYDRMIVKHGGKTEDGTSVTYTEDLSQTQDYGVLDWDNLGMALREFVSNAIDAATTFNSMSGVDTVYPWDGVVVEVVEDNQVRAKKGYTRVFIPMIGTHGEEVFQFRNNLGKWFLHFSEPESFYRVNTQANPLLPKANRNFKENSNTAVIYRRGVRVREISSWSHESLFDYNLDNLRVDESRNVDDYACQSAAARVLVNADAGSLTKLLGSFMTDKHYWEHGFSQWDMRTDIDPEQENRWEMALQNLAANAVLVQEDSGTTEILTHKGFKPIVVPEAYVRVGESMKRIRTASRVLSEDDRTGRQILPATEAVVSAVEWCWNNITIAGMTGGKEMPPVHCFISLMDGGSVLNGFYRDGEIYINENMSNGVSVDLRKVVLEELAHFITGSTDLSRDIQQWAFDYSTRIVMVRDGDLPRGV